MRRCLPSGWLRSSGTLSWPHSTCAGGGGAGRESGQAPKRSAGAGGGAAGAGVAGSRAAVAVRAQSSPVRRTAGITGLAFGSAATGAAVRGGNENDYRLQYGPVKPDGPHRGAAGPSKTAATRTDNACEEGKPWLIC